ncbi:hypothetical protein AHAS_Ahas06G0001600 [Arachis hypogaea]
MTELLAESTTPSSSSLRLLCHLLIAAPFPEVSSPSSSEKDNISNQREKIVHLLANEQSRLRIPDATDPNHEEELDDASIDPDVDLSYISIKSKQPETTNFGFPASDVGELQVDCLIGSGTFGTVYHGKWRGTDVAIKQITDRCFVRKPLEQERMAIKLVDLHHPNVVAFYGVVLDDLGGSVSTVTEYMVNGSLRTALLKNGRNKPALLDNPVDICHSNNSKGTSEISSANYPARSYGWIYTNLYITQSSILFAQFFGIKLCSMLLLGIRAGMFVRDAKALCPHLVTFPYNFEAYEEVAGPVGCSQSA